MLQQLSQLFCLSHLITQPLLAADLVQRVVRVRKIPTIAHWIFVVLVFFRLGHIAHAAPSCSIDGGVCIGDTVFAVKPSSSGAAQALISGKVQTIDAKANDTITLSIQASSVSIPRAAVAASRSWVCYEDLCPGRVVGYPYAPDPLKYDDRGVVIGVFPAGDLVVRSRNGQASVLEWRDLSIPSPEDTQRWRSAYPNFDRFLKSVYDELERSRGPNEPLHFPRRSRMAPPPLSACKEDGIAPLLSSPNLEKFRKLLEYGQSAPLQDFLILWDPSHGVTDGPNYLEECMDPGNYLRPIRVSLGGRMLKRCAPDVIYSWGPREKVASMEKAMPEGSTWSGPLNPGHEFWTAISPASTYNYGPVPVRIKLKPETVFMKLEARESKILPPKSVRAELWGKSVAFTLHSSDVIESWSYGTPEHYDEIVKDLWRLYSRKRFFGYFTRPDFDYFKDGDPLKQITNDDANPEDLKKGLLAIIQMILNREGKIHYAVDVCKNRQLHFATDRPTYFK